MNILERTKLLERVAEADRKSAEAVALVAELAARVAALEGNRTLTLKGKEAQQNGDGQRRPTS